MSTTDITATPVVAIDGQLDFLRRMLEIRNFEDECHRLFTQGLVRGSTHLGQGQEAVSVGTCRALHPGDTMTCTYRGHAATLAMGAPLDRAFGEILGKANGLCGGKGGSMHLTDVSLGALGSFAVVGAHLPIAVGAAFAARYKDTGAVTVCFFGDGSTNIGAFHEALNLASIWKLPVIFVCENNLYGEYSPIGTTTPVERLVDRADAYAMAKARVDGNDVLAVHATASDAAARARAGAGPTFIEALTYRHKGHSRSDPGAYRPENELKAWLERDPILVHERELLNAGVAQADLAAERAAAERAVTEALERARSWPEPTPESRLEHVYA
ncbi:MAG: thiamine pyrophosphate-dependent dehydrogenase E1 component subunit alpha [Candidatus Dormibacteria bacterium]